jgi:hypothetical protein
MDKIKSCIGKIIYMAAMQENIFKLSAFNSGPFNNVDCHSFSETLFSVNGFNKIHELYSEKLSSFSGDQAFILRCMYVLSSYEATGDMAVVNLVFNSPLNVSSVSKYIHLNNFVSYYFIISKSPWYSSSNIDIDLYYFEFNYSQIFTSEISTHFKKKKS